MFTALLKSEEWFWCNFTYQMPVFCFLNAGINLVIIINNWVEQALKFLEVKWAFGRDIACLAKCKEGELMETKVSKVHVGIS